MVSFSDSFSLFVYCSFQKGDVFLVENMIDSDWLWVKSLKDDTSGLVPKALTEVLVNSLFSVVPNVEWSWLLLVVLEIYLVVLESKISGEKWNTLINFLSTRFLLCLYAYHSLIIPLTKKT